MNWRQRNLMAEAVFIFNGHKIVRQMRYEVFRGLSARGQPLPELANSRSKAAYAAIGEGLRVEAICCFYAPFDAMGILDPDWEMPLRELAHGSGDGPDLGYGPIRLACRGKCSLPWHEANLWSPALGTQRDECQAVQKAVAANTLGIRQHAERRPRNRPAYEPPIPPASSLKARLEEAAADEPPQTVEARSATESSTDRSAGAASPSAPPRERAPERAASGSRSPTRGAERASASGDRARYEAITDAAYEELSQAEERFDAEFGRNNPRVPLRKLLRQQSLRIAEMRSQHEAEMRRLREKYETRIKVLKAEVERLKQKLTAERSK